MPSRPAARSLKLSDRFGEIKIRGHSASYLVFVVDQRYRRRRSNAPQGWPDSERPHLTQADPKFLGHLEKRVQVIELGDPHTGRVA